MALPGKTIMKHGEEASRAKLERTYMCLALFSLVSIRDMNLSDNSIDNRQDLAQYVCVGKCSLIRPRTI